MEDGPRYDINHATEDGGDGFLTSLLTMALLYCWPSVLYFTKSSKHALYFHHIFKFE